MHLIIIRRCVIKRLFVTYVDHGSCRYSSVDRVSLLWTHSPGEMRKLLWANYCPDEVLQLATKIHGIPRDFPGSPDSVRPSIDDFCHDVKNKLTVIKEFASIITDELGGPVTVEQKQYLEIITKAVNKTASMVNEFSRQHANPKE